MARQFHFGGLLNARAFRNCCIILCVVLTGCGSQNAPENSELAEVTGTTVVTQPKKVLSAEKREQIIDFCSDCHALPDPGSFPKSSWHEEVERGFNFYFDAEEQILTPPVFNEVVEFFQSQAPEAIPVAKIELPLDRARTPFQVPEIERRPITPENRLPAIAGMSLEPIGPNGISIPVFCDMRHGTVHWLYPEDNGNCASESIGQFKYPSRAHACDLDGDGIQDLIVAEMGSEDPEDHERGGVYWMRGTGKRGQFEVRPILENIGRVADVRSGDMDGDGDLDLIVGEFGYIKTGGIWVLTNKGPADPVRSDSLEFTAEEIDSRHGTIHTPIVDFDGDGDLDFLALVSQAYEAVDLFINDGNGEFTSRNLYEAEDPAFGSSGIEVDDIDGDGDYDVLYVNGDTFDSYFVKPYHGICWLENRGEESFISHKLTGMPGAQYATLGDADGDGDLDVVGVSLMPEFLRTAHRELRFASVIYLENDGNQNFSGSALEFDHCDHASCVLFDADQDGDLDLVVSNFLAETNETTDPVTIWKNKASTKPISE